MKIPTAKQVREVTNRNHREKHYRQLFKEDKSNIEFLQAVKSTLQAIKIRMDDTVIYSQKTFIYYNYNPTPTKLRAIEAVEKVFTIKGYEVKRLHNCLRISWGE